MSFHFLHRQVCTLWYISHRILQEEIWKKWFSIITRDKLTYLMELGELPKHKLKRVILVLSSSSCWLLVDYLEVDKWFIRKHWAGPGFLRLGPRFVEGNVVVSSSVEINVCTRLTLFKIGTCHCRDESCTKYSHAQCTSITLSLCLSLIALCYQLTGNSFDSPLD